MAVITFILITVVGCSSIGSQVSVNPTVDVQPTFSRTEEATKTPLPTNTPETTAIHEVTATPETENYRVVAIIGSVPEFLSAEVNQIPVASRRIENQNYHFLRDANGVPFTDGFIADDGSSKYGNDYLVYGLISGMVSYKRDGIPVQAFLVVDERIGNTNDFVRFVQAIEVNLPGSANGYDKYPAYGVGDLDALNNKIRDNKIKLNGQIPLDEYNVNFMINIGQLRPMFPLLENGDLIGMPVVMVIPKNGVNNQGQKFPSGVEVLFNGGIPPTTTHLAVVQRIFYPKDLLDTILKTSGN